MVKATYQVGTQSLHKYICIEHRGAAKHFADYFVEQLGLPPQSSAEGLIQAARSAERQPSKILVETDSKYPEILEVINKSSKKCATKGESVL